MEVQGKQASLILKALLEDYFECFSFWHAYYHHKNYTTGTQNKQIIYTAKMWINPPLKLKIKKEAISYFWDSLFKLLCTNKPTFLGHQ
jgi:hypothetical protein